MIQAYGLRQKSLGQWLTATRFDYYSLQLPLIPTIVLIDYRRATRGKLILSKEIKDQVSSNYQASVNY